MKNMPLVIINFEGIIGEILTLPIFSPDAKKGLYLKNGVIENMKRLFNKFQLAIVTEIDSNRFMKILDYFKIYNIIFDGVYIREKTEESGELFSEYSHIFNDFEIEPEDVKWNVLLLCPILLENEEIKARSNEELVFDYLYN